MVPWRSLFLWYFRSPVLDKSAHCPQNNLYCYENRSPCDWMTYGLNQHLLVTWMMNNLSGRPHRSVMIYLHSQRTFRLFQLYPNMTEAPCWLITNIFCLRWGSRSLIRFALHPHWRSTACTIHDFIEDLSRLTVSGTANVGATHYLPMMYPLLRQSALTAFFLPAIDGGPWWLICTYMSQNISTSKAALWRLCALPAALVKGFRLVN